MDMSCEGYFLRDQIYSFCLEDGKNGTKIFLCAVTTANNKRAELWRIHKIIPTFLNPQQSLDNRYRLLCKQRDDAKDLKDNLDRRERMVSTFLSRQLTDTQLQEYRRFIQTKASLLIRQKDLDEKQRLGEEQLEALLSSIPPWNCTAWKCLSSMDRTYFETFDICAL